MKTTVKQHSLLLNASDGIGKMSRTSIFKIISVDTRQNNVVQAPSADSFGSVFRLMRVQRLGISVRLYWTEAAATSTFIAHQHDSCSSSLMFTTSPAVSNIRASSLLANSVKVETSQILLDTSKVLTHWNVGLKPRGQTRLLAAYVR